MDSTNSNGAPAPAGCPSRSDIEVNMTGGYAPTETLVESKLVQAGGGAHAPDEYWVVEPANAKVAGMDGAARSFVEFLYAMA